MVEMNLFPGQEQRRRLEEQTRGHRARGRREGGIIEKVVLTYIYTHTCKIARWWEAAALHREPSSVLCDDPEGWGGGWEGGSRGRGHMHTHS